MRDCFENTFPLRCDLTDALSEYVSDLRFETLPKTVLDSAKLLLLDYVAAAHAGYRVNIDFNRSLYSALSCGTCRGSSTVFFSENGMPPLNAAMLNAAYAHGADMDDGNKMAAGHVAAHILPSVMSLAEARHMPNKTLFEAMVAGYDVFCRLSAACMPDMIDRGFHSTGTVGAIAAAAASAKLLGLERDGVYHAIALAASQASGLLLVGETGQEAKPLNPAKAAQSGVLAALLSEEGVAGPERPLESSKGWCHAMASKVNVGLVLTGLGSRHYIEECYMKPYPSCRHTHGAIEAAFLLRGDLKGKPLERVQVHTYGHAIELAGQIEIPRSTGEAKFSIQYAVATALLKGTFGLIDLNTREISEDIKRLAKRIKLIRDDSYENPAKGMRGARVIAFSADGKKHERSVSVPKGDPENPFDLDDIKSKLRSCCCNRDGSLADNADVDEFVSLNLERWCDPEADFIFPRNAKWECV